MEQSEALVKDWVHDFFREKCLVMIGSGLSSALCSDFGMSTLQRVLEENEALSNLKGQSSIQWEEVRRSLAARHGLENALDAVTEQELLRLIVSVTGSFIAEIDKRYGCQLASGKAAWPGAGLLKRLVEALPPSDPVQHIVTPNYDTLIEHSCHADGIYVTNGYVGNIVRSLDWQAAELAMCASVRVIRGRKAQTSYRPKKHIRLHKVHGSLSYFNVNDSIVDCPAWMWSPPLDARRVIITPGVSKLGATHSFRQELLRWADHASEKENQFLFIGYGFNDSHLDVYIRRKLINQKCSGLIITRDGNERINSLMAEAPNLCMFSKPEGASGTIVSGQCIGSPVQFKELELWNVSKFTDHFLRT